MPMLYGRRYFPFLAIAFATLSITTGESFARDLSLGHTTPVAPSEPRPSDGAYDQMITVGMSWTGGAGITYDVYLGIEADPPLVASNIHDPIYRGEALEFETVYYWRIVARDELGGETSSPVWSFLTKDNAPPLLPIDPHPAHTTWVDPPVTLRWKSGDPDLQPMTYRVFLGTSTNPPLIASGLTERFLELPNLEANQTYYWRVIASDGTFNVGSQTWRFHLRPLPVAFAQFDAVQDGDDVNVTWAMSSDEAIAEVKLYRRGTHEVLPTPIATIDAVAESYRDDTVEVGSTYEYEMVVLTADEEVYRSPIATVTLRARALALMQNYPNPFNPQTTIAYDLPAGLVHVRLSVFDLAGHVVRTLVDVDQAGGSHEVEWDGRNDHGDAVASGVYLYALDVGKQRMTKKLVLLK